MVDCHPALGRAVIVAIDAMDESGVRKVGGQDQADALIDHPAVLVQDDSALQIAVLIGIGPGMHEQVYVYVLVGTVVPGPHGSGQDVVPLGDAVRVLIDQVESPEAREEEIILTVAVAVVRALGVANQYDSLGPRDAVRVEPEYAYSPVT